MRLTLLTQSPYLTASTLLFGGRMIGAAAMFGAQIVLARTTSSEVLAMFFLATSLVTVAGTLSALGYPYIAVRLIRRYDVTGRLQRGSAFVAVARRDTFIVSVGLTVILGAGILLLPVGSWAEKACLLAALPAVPAIALSRTNGAIARARGWFWVAYLPTIMWRPVLFLLVLVAAFLILGFRGLVLPVALFAGIAIIGAAAQSYWLRTEPSSSAGSDARLTRSWRRTAGPFIAISMFELLFVDVGLLIAGTALPRPELAVFAVCLKLAFFAGFVVDVLHELAMSDLAAAKARNDPDAVKRHIVRANAVAVSVTLLMLGLCALFGRTALGLFGEEYQGGETTLLVLMLIPVLNALGGPHFAILTIDGAQAHIMRVYAVSGAVLLGLTLLLGPAFGPAGAAISVLVTFFVLNVFMAIAASRLTGTRTHAWNLVAFWRDGRSALPPASSEPAASAGRLPAG